MRTTHKELTDEQKAEYVKSPFHCPYCGSEEIQAGDRTSDGRYVFQNVDCCNPLCQAFWTEEYTITGICNENCECDDCAGTTTE